MEMSSLITPATPSPNPLLRDKEKPDAQNGLSSVPHHLRQTWREIWDDIRTTGWRGTGASFLGLFWFSGLIIAIAALSIFTRGSDSYPDACHPDGNFSPFSDTYDWWAPEGFFQITLRAPEVSFAAAKVIDIAWDVVIGRGGQTVLAWVTWRVFADFLTVSIATKPATYTTFFIVFLQRENSLNSIYLICRDFIFVRGGLSSKVATYFMVATMAFVLASPTFASSMTGYTTADRAYVTLNDDNMFSFSEAKPIAYMIHDGSRIGLENDYAVPFAENSGARISKYMYLPDTMCYNDSATSYSYNNGDYSELSCGLQTNVSQCKSLLAQNAPFGPMIVQLMHPVHADVSEYGFYGLTKKESKFNGTTLKSPVLNITAFYLPQWTFGLYGYTWQDSSGNYPFQNRENASFSISGEIYGIKQLQELGTCQPVLKKFQWGFSFVQVMIMLALLLIWTIGIYIMWLKARLTLRLNGHPGTAHGWHCLLQLADIMEKQLEDVEIDSGVLSESELNQQIRRLLEGGSVMSPVGFPKGTYSFRRGIFSWLKRERWWVPFLIGLVASLIILPVYTSSLPGLVIVVPGVVMSFSVGRAAKTILFLLLCLLFVSLPVCIETGHAWGPAKFIEI
ncbi:hypothetical protein AK830_g2296 [Neonectria ditissima]|uniref:Uncharacterized protein n=1 Tax=Neonectria ditissima TaxID=78410 RepID=A0A0P7BV96_9HYPO|nr:hypothetical protein AK830_g2296 [Neonectria ditissima]